MPRRPGVRATGTAGRRETRRDAANPAAGRRTRARPDQDCAGGSLLHPHGADDDVEEILSVITMDTQRGRPSYREMHESMLGRKHLLKEKWVVVENFASEAWMEKMLAMEQAIRQRNPECAKPLRFEGSEAVDPRREMVVVMPKQHDPHGRIVTYVNRRLERLSFRTILKGEPPSHYPFRPTFLVSTGTRDEPMPAQPVHADFNFDDDAHRRSDVGFGTPLPFPFGVLIALEEGTRFVNGETEEEIEIPRGGAFIFHGGFPHADAECFVRNVKLRVYYPISGTTMPEDEQGNLVVYTIRDIDKEREKRTKPPRVDGGLSHFFSRVARFLS